MSTKQFEVWWAELEGFGLRCERFDVSRDEALAIWRVAYEQALEDAAIKCEGRANKYHNDRAYWSGAMDCAHAVRALGAETGTEKPQ